MTRLALGLDVGGSHVTAGLVDVDARHVQRTARRDVPHSAPLGTILRAWVDATLEAAGPQVLQVTHLGVAVPGPFDLPAGTSSMTHKFRALHGVPLRPALRAAFGDHLAPELPIHFGNDADLFALGEWWGGADRPERLLGVTLGTGLGSGFILRGTPQRGGPGVPPGGELWNVPAPEGHLEDALSGAAITRLGAALTGRQGSAADWAQSARRGHSAALALWAEFGTRAGQRLTPWTEAFGADVLVLGGNVSQAFDLFAPTLEVRDCEVRLSRYFELAPLLGTAALGEGHQVVRS